MEDVVHLLGPVLQAFLRAQILQSQFNLVNKLQKKVHLLTQRCTVFCCNVYNALVKFGRVHLQLKTILQKSIDANRQTFFSHFLPVPLEFRETMPQLLKNRAVFFKVNLLND